MALIVVVEDDPDNRYALELIVRRFGHEVISADNGYDAVQLIRDRKPQLVITDQQMPRMTGVDLARAVAAEAAISHIPIVMASGSTDMNSSPDLAGITAHISKPYVISELKRLLATVLRDAEPEPGPEGTPKG